MSVVKLEVAQILFSLQDTLALNVTTSLENGRIASRHLAMESLLVTNYSWNFGVFLFLKKKKIYLLNKYS